MSTATSTPTPRVISAAPITASTRAKVIPVYINSSERTVAVLEGYYPPSLKYEYGLISEAEKDEIEEKYENRETAPAEYVNPDEDTMLEILNMEANRAKIAATFGDVVYVMYYAGYRNTGKFTCGKDGKFVDSAVFDYGNLPPEILVTADPRFHAHYWEGIFSDNVCVWASFSEQDKRRVAKACEKREYISVPVTVHDGETWYVIVTPFTYKSIPFKDASYACFLPYIPLIEELIDEVADADAADEEDEGDEDEDEDEESEFDRLTRFVTYLGVPEHHILIRVNPAYAGRCAILDDEQPVDF